MLVRHLLRSSRISGGYQTLSKISVPHTQSPNVVNRINTSHFHSSAAAFARKADFYDVLGVNRDSTKSEIKKSYHQKAKQYHPDVNKDAGAEKKFREVTEAYEVLEDDKKRKMYDAYGHAGVDENVGNQHGNPFGGGNPFGQGVHVQWGDGGFGGGGGQEGHSIFDIFEQAFGQQGGGGFGGQQRSRGKDVQAAVQLSFFEIVTGCSRDLEFEYYESAPVQGKGGSRQRVKKSKKVKVDIPAGVDSGTQLRMSKLGVPSPDGKHTGDLYVEIHVHADPYFRRNNQDLHVEVPISVTQAILGGTVDVLTVDGMIEMKVQPGTQPNSKLLLKERGLPIVNSRNRRGNQYVHISVQIPKDLNSKQKDLLTEYNNEEIRKNGGDPEAIDADAGSSGVKRPFSIEEAWKRVKSFVSSCEKEKEKEAREKERKAEAKRAQKEKEAEAEQKKSAAA